LDLVAEARKHWEIQAFLFSKNRLSQHHKQEKEAQWSSFYIRYYNYMVILGQAPRNNFLLNVPAASNHLAFVFDNYVVYWSCVLTVR
jgi:hypothetical protein